MPQPPRPDSPAMSPSPRSTGGVGAGDLERAVTAVEQALAVMQEALQGNDATRVEAACDNLRQTLSCSVTVFREAARHQAVPAPMKRRLAGASARIAAQREALARATTALDRAIDVLLPQDQAGYAASGRAAHRSAKVWITA
jgi:ribosomal protein S7